MRFATSLTLLALMTGGAAAQPALDDAGKPQSTLDPAAAPTSLETAGPKPEYGAELRLRQVFVPTALLELFVERSAGGASNTGIGGALVRRRGNLELQLGFEFEHIEVKEGVWINSGDNVSSGDEADYILSPDSAGTSLGWFTVEFTFLNHAPINKYVAVRYGGGAGIGFLTGALQKYDVMCVGATNDTPEPGCKPNTLGGNGVDDNNAPEDYDLPPVFPVVNAIIGVQIRPIPKAVINIETGIRTLPFVGLSGATSSSFGARSALAADVADAERELLGVEVLGERDRELARHAGEILPLLRVDRLVLLEEGDETRPDRVDTARVHHEIGLDLHRELGGDEPVERGLDLRLGQAEDGWELLGARRLETTGLELGEDRALDGRQGLRLRGARAADPVSRGIDNAAALETGEDRIVATCRKGGGKLGA
jgi:hypothetical protein